MYTCDPVARSLFDNLDILPLRLRLLAARRSATALIRGGLSPRVDQGGAIVAFAIGRHGGWCLGMPTLFELLHQVVRDIFLGLANRTSDAQPGIHIQGYAAPEGTALVSFGIAPFSP